jgi:uncharacterized membrane protein YbhN (UPF0104 family)
MIATDHTVSELALPALDVRALARRAGPPALLAGTALMVVLLAGGRVNAFADAVGRGLSVSPVWAIAGAVFEFISLAGYVGLLSLVVGRVAPRVGPRESAQITLAGAAATRLLPTAGAGGVALTMWTLRRAGMRTETAARTLLAFMLVLYSVFLASIVISGALLAAGAAGHRGPAELSAIPAAVAMLAIVLCLALAWRRHNQPETGDGGDRDDRRRRVRGAARMVGDACRDACRLVRLGDLRLAGAIAYWAFDAAVVWAMLHAFGAPPELPVIALAYFVGQAANTLPIPGSVSAGIAGVLIAFGVAPALAIPSVLAYRAIAVWLPSPVALAAVPALRRTIARWEREDAGVAASV